MELLYNPTAPLPTTPGKPLHAFRVLCVVPIPADNHALSTILSGITPRKVTVTRVKNMLHINITPFVTAMSWGASDDDLFTNLRLTLNNFKGLFNQLPLGAKVQVLTRKPFYSGVGTDASGAKWYPYMELYIVEKNRAGDGSSQTMDLTLYDKMHWLATRSVQHVFKPDKKKHKRGWTATQIIKWLCKTYGIPVGKIDVSSVPLTKVDFKGSLIDLIRRVLKQDKVTSKRTGNYTIDMVDGNLNVRLDKGLVPRKAYVIDERDMLESGTLRESLDEKTFATRITVTGKQRLTSPRSTKADTIYVIKNIEVTKTAGVAYTSLYGVKPQTVHLKGLHTKAQMQKKAAYLLAQALKPTREFSVTLRAIPFLWPGQKIYVRSAYFGIKGLVRISGVQYEVSGNDFTMTLTLSVDNKTVLTAAQERALKKQLARVRY